MRYGLVAAYAYGTVVHLANIFGFNGFDWTQAPLRWQLLDVCYLVLDVVVVWGLLFHIRTGLVFLVIAAGSQIVLYTVLRDWVLDVPTTFAPSPQEQSYLTTLVVFHVFTLAAVMFALLRHRKWIAALLMLLLFVSGVPPVSANTPTITGVWASPGLAMVVRIEPCETDSTVSCGRFVWSWDSDDSLKLKLGSTVLQDIKADGEKWRDSLIDPSSGRTYRGTLHQVDDHTLVLRGCFGLICRSQTWRSVDSVAAALYSVLGES